MPISATRGGIAANPLLTNFAAGLAQDLTSASANFIAPVITVDASIGRYKKYDDKNQFQIPNTSRAIGGPASRINFDATDGYYNCLPQSLEAPIDDAELKALGSANPINLQMSKTRVLVTSAALAHEVKALGIVSAASTGTGGTGWSTNTGDPIPEIDLVMANIAIATGQMPNRILFGIQAWQRFKNHTKVLNRVYGGITGAGGQALPPITGATVTTANAAGVFINPNVSIMVGTLSQDASKEGKAAVKTNIVGSTVYIFYASPNPDQYDGSFAKTFYTAGNGITGVYVYRDDRSRSNVVALDWHEDIQITNSLSGQKLVVT